MSGSNVTFTQVTLLLEPLKTKVATKHKKGGKALVRYLSDKKVRADLNHFSDNNEGVTWHILIKWLKLAIDQDFQRNSSNASKKLSPELCDNLRRVINFCEADDPGQFLKDSISSTFKWIHNIFYQLINHSDGELDQHDEARVIAKHLSSILLKLLEPLTYNQVLSPPRCGKLLCILFDLLDQSRSNTCVAIGKLIHSLTRVCVNGTLGSRSKSKNSVARELEVSNMFEADVTLDTSLIFIVWWNGLLNGFKE